MYRNRVLRRIFGTERYAETGGLRKLHNEELHKFYCLSNISRMTKSRKKRWVGYVERVGRTGMHIGYWWESQKERNH
jgi:hypothetical protein